MLFLLFLLPQVTFAEWEPVNLTATAVKDQGNTFIVLNWDQEGSDLGYRVSRKEEGGSEQEIYILEPGTETELSTGGIVSNKVTEGHTYTYSVVSFNRIGDESSPVSVTIVASDGATESTTGSGPSGSGTTTGTGSTSGGGSSGGGSSTGAGVQVGVSIPGYGNHFTFSSYVCAFLVWSMRVAFALAVLMVVYAGIRYILSAGNQTQVNDAKDIITSSLTGFAFLILIVLVLKILNVNSCG